MRQNAYEGTSLNVPAAVLSAAVTGRCLGTLSRNSLTPKILRKMAVLPFSAGGEGSHSERCHEEGEKRK